MFSLNRLRNLLTYTTLLGALILLSLLTRRSSALAQDDSLYIREVRIFDPGFEMPHVTGLAFSPQANAFLLLADHTRGAANLLLIDPSEDLIGSAHLPTITSPINMTYDSKANRPLLLDTATNELLEIKTRPSGLDPATIRRFPAGSLGLLDPQGMALDPASGHLFILDSATAAIVRIEADGQRSFNPATALVEGRISRVGLNQPGLGRLRGLAFNPTNRHLYFLSLVELKLYEITETGQFVASRDMSDLDLLLRDPQGMVFAPSGDSTDDPAQMSLYLVDSGLGPVLTPPSGHHQKQGRENASPPDQLAAPGVATEGALAEQGPGRIIEFTLTSPVEILQVSATASSFTSSLVRTTDMSAESQLQVSAAASSSSSSLVKTIDTSKWSPPSPDPSGLTYLPNSNTLLTCDGEVEETVSGITHFQGANVWEFTLGGSVVDTANISERSPTLVPMTNEPTGVTWNPTNGHFFFSADDGKEVYDLNPGADGLIGTADDTWTSFDTKVWGNGDPEGIAFDTWNNFLFVADGVNREVYKYTLSGTMVSHFDVQAYGVEDPESVEFNPESGTLFVMSSNDPVIVETTTDGVLLQTIDISAANPRAAAGLAYAPASNGSGAKRFYIVDRGIDNDSDPDIIDGKVYEMTAPSSTPVDTPPVANDDSATTSEDTAVTINVAANDFDPNGNLNPASATTACGAPCDNPNNGVLLNHGNGSFTYTPNSGFTGADSFVYRICDTTSLCDTATVSITVNPEGLTILEVRVSASSDDAEQNASGSVSLTSSDLELVVDSSVQTVGIRFNGITIPQGAAIFNAYIQFQVDEVSTDTASLTIQGQKVDNAATFTTATNNISSRLRTDAEVSWNPPSWPTVGQAGPDQRTSNLAAVVHEIVGQSGWSSGNSLVIIITGSGKRAAEAFDGVPAAAPLLHVEYSTGAPSDPPVANDDSASTSEDTAVTINVAANDTDPDGNLNPASATTTCGGCANPANGTLVNHGNGSFTYTPNLNFNGPDSFVYRICDTAGMCDTATVSITVNPVADPPVANDDSASTSEDTAVTINVAANDTDPDGNLNPASANTTCVGCANPTNGALLNHGNGSFTYTPNSGFTGPDSFVYQICDTTSLCDTASVALTVNPASTANFRLSLASNGTVGAVAARDEDILDFNGTSFAMLFDGSDVGVGGVDLDAFYVVDADTILMSFDDPVTIGTLGTVADADIVRFDATSLGDNTAGSFSMYFDGSDVGLDTSSEDVDAIELLSDGRLLISTSGSISVPGVSGADEDLLVFTPTSLGDVTSGTWAMYFDGSDVGLSTTSSEDVDGVSVAANGDIYLTTRGNFAVTGVSGADEDVFVCTPSSLGTTTTCTYAPTLFFDGSAFGLDANDLDAIDLP